MMNTIAEEGINSDGREVIMTVQERGKTDAEMTGMTGKLRDVETVSLGQQSHNPMQPSPLKHNATKWFGVKCVM